MMLPPSYEQQSCQNGPMNFSAPQTAEPGQQLSWVYGPTTGSPNVPLGQQPQQHPNAAAAAVNFSLPNAECEGDRQAGLLEAQGGGGVMCRFSG